MSTDILVIDNSRKSIAYIAALTGFGYNITEAHSPEEAFSLLDTGEMPRTVIVDLKLADLEAVLPTLREGTGNGAQMIVISGDEEAAYAAGADVVVAKPVQLPELLHAVRHNVIA
jgi:CheY-like chemotaxis protein